MSNGSNSPRFVPGSPAQSSQPGPVATSPPPAEASIPAEQAAAIRRLVHDLSNGLEIIIQSSYLIGTSDLPEETRQWLKLLEQGVQQSARTNQELRAYIIAHS